MPPLYLAVEEIRPSGKSLAEDAIPEVSVAVSFVSRYEDSPRIYASYVSFRPGEPGGLDRAARWLKETYVEGEYKGRILTDFDQTKVHFPEAALSLRRVMGRHLRQGELEQALEIMHAAGYAQRLFSIPDLAAFLDPATAVARTKIFVSYAPAGCRLVEAHSRAPPAARPEQKVDLWADPRIQAGENWKEEIETAIESARVAILLVSADFLARTSSPAMSCPDSCRLRAETGLVIPAGHRGRLPLGVRVGARGHPGSERHATADHDGRGRAGADLERPGAAGTGARRFPAMSLHPSTFVGASSRHLLPEA